MIRYTALRLLQAVPVLFGISVVVFLLVRLIPGDPAIAVLGSRATPQLIARVHDELGLDLPLDGPKTINGLLLETLQDIPEASVSLKIANVVIEIVQVQEQAIRMVKLYRPQI